MALDLAQAVLYCIRTLAGRAQFTPQSPCLARLHSGIFMRAKELRHNKNKSRQVLTQDGVLIILTKR